MSTPDLTVVVKHYRRPYLLEVCLRSLSKWPRDRIQVIVADDGTDPMIVDEIQRRCGGLYDWWVDNPAGAGKWALARAGRFAEIVHTCGATWNRAMSAVRSDHVFVIEDDSRVVQGDFYPHIALMHSDKRLLCVIGLRQRLELEHAGFGDLVSDNLPDYRVFTHVNWPWSFDSIFFRRDEWCQIGPWPEGVSTGAMEDWLTGRLRTIGWIGRPYAVTREPVSSMSEESRVRVDPVGSGENRPWLTWVHADMCLRAWLKGWSMDEDNPVFPEGLRPSDFGRGVT